MDQLIQSTNSDELQCCYFIHYIHYVFYWSQNILCANRKMTLDGSSELFSVTRFQSPLILHRISPQMMNQQFHKKS